MRPQSIAILGAGPSGSTLANYLARAGLRVALFSTGRKTDFLVGESLVPALIPYLKDLGVEEEVRQYSILKPGATFFTRSRNEATFLFDQDKKSLPSYAYNVPRKEFDETLLNAALRAGVPIFQHTADVKRKNNSDRIELTDESIQATQGFFSGQPDFIVDATGRRQLVARTLKIPLQEKAQKDTVLFAHLNHTKITHKGNIHTDFLEHGWSWRIPLPGRVSVGIVAPTEYVNQMGKTATDQFDRMMQTDPILRDFSQDSQRITDVKKYCNYQMINKRISGEGWALIGDAAGFIDPVFSSGLLLALSSAKFLSKALLSGTKKQFKKFEERMADQIQSWQRIVDYFYDGRLFTLIKYGQAKQKTVIGRLVNPHIHKHMSRLLTGISTTSPYSRGLLEFLIHHGIRHLDPRQERIC